MLDQKSDEPFMRAQRRAMNADWNLVDVIAVFVAKIKTAGLRKIDLVSGERELAADHAPHLHVDLWSVKRGLVRHFDIIDAGIL